MLFIYQDHQFHDIHVFSSMIIPVESCSCKGRWKIYWDTVYPKKNAHVFCFAVLCCGYTLTDFPISIRLTSLALWQSNDCPRASKATLMNMDKYFMWIRYGRLHNHNKAKHNKTVCIFLGIFCNFTMTTAMLESEHTSPEFQGPHPIYKKLLIGKCMLFNKTRVVENTGLATKALIYAPSRWPETLAYVTSPSVPAQILTNLPLNKRTTISQITFSDAFSWMKRFGFWLKSRLFLRVQSTILQQWFR